MLGFATTTVKIILGIAPMLQEGKEFSQNPIILKTDFQNNRDTRFPFVDENKKQNRVSRLLFVQNMLKLVFGYFLYLLVKNKR